MEYSLLVNILPAGVKQWNVCVSSFIFYFSPEEGETMNTGKACLKKAIPPSISLFYNQLALQSNF